MSKLHWQTAGHVDSEEYSRKLEAHRDYNVVNNMDCDDKLGGLGEDIIFRLMTQASENGGNPKDMGNMKPCSKVFLCFS